MLEKKGGGLCIDKMKNSNGEIYEYYGCENKREYLK